MGTPSLSIVWEREGALLGNGHLVGNDLVFDEALPDHAGTYMCVASSDGQDPVTASATVTVNCESEDDVLTDQSVLYLPRAVALYLASHC